MSELVIAIDLDGNGQSNWSGLIDALARSQKPAHRLATFSEMRIDSGTVVLHDPTHKVEGWLVGEGRRGTRVAERSPQRDKRARSSALRSSIDQFVSSLVGRGYSRHEIVAEIERLSGT